jgi:tripartite-type tricarboxylate transporter receptor subunit TctC
LFEAAARIIAQPAVQERLAQEGLQALPSASPEEFDAFVRREIPFWAEVVRTAGATVE